MNLADLLKDIIDTSRERVKNHITGNYFIFWLAFNWKFILYLISSGNENAARRVYNASIYLDGYSFLFPLIASILFVPVVTIVSEFIEKTIAAKATSRKIIPIRSKTEILKAEEKHIRADKRNKQLKENYDEIKNLEDQVSDRNSQISKLVSEKNSMKDVVSSLNSSNDSLEKEIKRLKKTISSNQIQNNNWLNIIGENIDFNNLTKPEQSQLVGKLESLTSNPAFRTFRALENMTMDYTERIKSLSQTEIEALEDANLITLSKGPSDLIIYKKTPFGEFTISYFLDHA
jgi:predicted RNase H-like nuclease (RuvC/YqgF family)